MIECLFDNFAPGAGAGLRVLLNRRSSANRCCDVGAGRHGSKGLSFAVEEAFWPDPIVNLHSDEVACNKDGKTSGVILAQAGYFGGWVLCMKDGKVHHEYNWFALERTNVAGGSALAPGRHTIQYEFIPDEAKPGTGGKSILSVGGKTIAEGHIPKAQPFVFSGDEGTDVGVDGETNVSNDYKRGANAFAGRIVKVTVERK